MTGESATVDGVAAWEVLDSRGDPTVRVRVTAGDATGTFTVPSGASTGAHEAVERRDGGDRYGGRGVREAVRAVRAELAPVVRGRDVTDQTGVDAALEDRDGRDDLSRLGANAVLGVSGAVAHAAAEAVGEPLYRYLADGLLDDGRGSPGALPLPMVNVFSGGLHARGGIEIQDFLVVPVGAGTYPAAVETAWAVRAAARERVLERGQRPLVADEGGFAPGVDTVDGAFELLLASVGDAGFEPGEDVAFAVDVAATHFHEDGTYVLGSLDRRFDRAGMVDLVARWVEEYPLVSVEDPLAEDDWTGWERLADRVGDRVQLLGDDLVATDRQRLARGVEAGAANGLIVKPNQAGTLTRTLRVVETARSAGWAPVVSARSGETCDATVADLAVARDAGQIKIGSLARSERLAKYNRLFGIANDPSHEGGFAGADALARWE
ncbi:MAG: phosphopyruvate hydratase [Haloarculaceae archaeon]